MVVDLGIFCSFSIFFHAATISSAFAFTKASASLIKIYRIHSKFYNLPVDWKLRQQHLDKSMFCYDCIYFVVCFALFRYSLVEDPVYQYLLLSDRLSFLFH